MDLDDTLKNELLEKLSLKPDELKENIVDCSQVRFFQVQKMIMFSSDNCIEILLCRVQAATEAGTMAPETMEI